MGEKEKKETQQKLEKPLLQQWVFQDQRNVPIVRSSVEVAQREEAAGGIADRGGKNRPHGRGQTLNKNRDISALQTREKGKKTRVDMNIFIVKGGRKLKEIIPNYLDFSLSIRRPGKT